MIYLIGGPARTGKTTLVKELVRRRPMHAISSDAIRYMFRHAVPKEALDPDLFIHFSSDVMDADKSFEERLELQDRESRSLWPALTELIHAYDEDGIDIVIEGVAITPAFVKQLNTENRSLFLVNLSPEHEKVIAEQARANAHDLLHDASPEKIAACADFFRFMSQWYISECDDKGMSYVEVADHNFEMSLSRAASMLMH